MEAKGRQKGARSESMGDQNASKSQSSEKVAKREQIWCLWGVPRGSATIHFGNHFHEKNDAKIMQNGPKRPESDPKNIQKRPENDPKTQLVLDLKLPEKKSKINDMGLMGAFFVKMIHIFLVFKNQ